MSQPENNQSPPEGKFIVYGATGAVGRDAVHRLSQQGYALHLAGRKEEALKEIAGATTSSYTVGDVRDESHFKQVAEEAGPGLLGLLYAVGTINLASLSRVQAEQIREDFEVNGLGAALAVQAAAPALKKSENASVVLFSSIAASSGFAFHTSISMAKAAVEGLTVTLASELAPRVRVNAIAPSLTRTPLSRSLLANEKLADAMAKQHALKRLGEPCDMAELAVFLLTSCSGWITGQVLHVDGGRSTLPLVG